MKKTKPIEPKKNPEADYYRDKWVDAEKKFRDLKEAIHHVFELAGVPPHGHDDEYD